MVLLLLKHILQSLYLFYPENDALARHKFKENSRVEFLAVLYTG